MSPLGHKRRARLASAIWNGIAGALPRIALLLAGLYVAQRFGADLYARYSLAIVTLSLAGLLPSATLTTTASRFVPEFDQRGEGGQASVVPILSFAGILAAAIGAVLWILAPALASTFRLDPPVTDLLRVVVPVVVVAILAGGAFGLHVGRGRFRTAAIAQLVAFAAFAASCIPLCTRFGIAGAVLALGVHYLVLSGTSIGVAWRTSALRRPAGRLPDQWRKLGHFFVPALVSAGLVTPVIWLVNAILARGPEPLAELSRLNAAYSWFAVVSFIPAVLAQVEFVRLSQARARGETEALARELRRFTLRNAVVMAPLCAALALLAGPAMGLYRTGGAAAEHTLQLLMAAAFAASLGNPAGLFLAVIDRIWLASALNLGWGIIAVAVSWALRDHGAAGATFALLVGYALHAVVAHRVAHRQIPRFMTS